MNEEIKNIFKPTIGKIIFSLIFLSWQYSYSYLGIRFYYLDLIGDYFKVGLSGVSWDNYFIKSGFMVIIWLIVASIIFFMIWGYQSYKIFIYNQKIKKDFVNKQDESYNNLLKKQTIDFKKHFTHYLYFGGAFTLIIAGFSLFSDLIEKIRFNISDSIILNLIENNAIKESSTGIILIISFIMIYAFWYAYAGAIFATYKIGKNEYSQEKISDEHYSVVVEDSEIEEED